MAWHAWSTAVQKRSSPRARPFSACAIVVRSQNASRANPACVSPAASRNVASFIPSWRRRAAIDSGSPILPIPATLPAPTSRFKTGA